MSTGVLYSGTALADGTVTTVYTAPFSKVGTVNITVTNPSSVSTAVNIRMKFYDIELNTVLPPYGTLERGGLVLGAGDTLGVESSVETVYVTVYGYEE